MWPERSTSKRTSQNSSGKHRREWKYLTSASEIFHHSKIWEPHASQVVYKYYRVSAEQWWHQSGTKAKGTGKPGDRTQLKQAERELEGMDPRKSPNNQPFWIRRSETSLCGFPCIAISNSHPRRGKEQRAFWIRSGKGCRRIRDN